MRMAVIYQPLADLAAALACSGSRPAPSAVGGAWWRVAQDDGLVQIGRGIWRDLGTGEDAAQQILLTGTEWGRLGQQSVY